MYYICINSNNKMDIEQKDGLTNDEKIWKALVDHMHMANQLITGMWEWVRVTPKSKIVTLGMTQAKAKREMKAGIERLATLSAEIIRLHEEIAKEQNDES